MFSLARDVVQATLPMLAQITEITSADYPTVHYVDEWLDIGQQQIILVIIALERCGKVPLHSPSPHPTPLGV